MKSTLLRGLALCGAAAVMCAAAIAPAHASTFTMSFSGPPLVIPVVGSFGGTDLGEFRINPFSADFALSTPDCVGSGPTFICDLTLSAPSASDPAPVTYMSPASAPSGFDSVSPEIVGTVDLSVTHNASGQTTTQAYSYRGNVFENPFSGLYSAQFEFFGTSLSANDMNPVSYTHLTLPTIYSV